MGSSAISITSSLSAPSKTLISFHLKPQHHLKTPQSQIRSSFGSNDFVSISSSSETPLRAARHITSPISSQLISSAVCFASADGSELSTSSPDVVTLDVQGMMCEGCTSSVKRILESQPQVSSASVNLKTETAYVQPVDEAKATPNWQQELGEALAKHLTNCGFNSTPRGLHIHNPEILLLQCQMPNTKHFTFFI